MLVCCHITVSFKSPSKFILKDHVEFENNLQKKVSILLFESCCFGYTILWLILIAAPAGSWFILSFC